MVGVLRRPVFLVFGVESKAGLGVGHPIDPGAERLRTDSMLLTPFCVGQATCAAFFDKPKLFFLRRESACHVGCLLFQVWQTTTGH